MCSLFYSSTQYCILFNDQNTAARIRIIGLALLSNRQVTPPNRTIYIRPGEEEIAIEYETVDPLETPGLTLYLNAGDTSPPVYITSDPLEIAEDK
jgi:hypothetical protein